MSITTDPALAAASAAALEYVRSYYGVPAVVGARVRYTGEPGRKPYDGRIVGGYGCYLRVEFEALPGRSPMLLHPTWEVEYLP
jgi:hypothetical protein